MRHLNQVIEKKMGDDNVNLSVSSHPPSIQLLNLEVFHNSNAQNDNELEALNIGIASSNVSIQNLINFKPIDVSDCKQLCSELGLQLEQESMGLDNAEGFLIDHFTNYICKR